MSVGLQARVDAAAMRSAAFHAERKANHGAAVDAALDAGVLNPLASAPLQAAVATARNAPRLKEHVVDLGDESATVWRSPVADSVTVALPLDAIELDKSVERVRRDRALDGATALDLLSYNLAPAGARSILTSLVALLPEWAGPNYGPGPVEKLRAGLARRADDVLPKHLVSYGLTKNVRGSPHQLIHLAFDRDSRAFQPHAPNGAPSSQMALPAEKRAALVAPYREMLEDLVFQNLLAGAIARLSWHGQIHWHGALVSVTDNNSNYYHDDDLRVCSDGTRLADWKAILAAAPTDVMAALPDPSVPIGERMNVARYLAREASLKADAIAALRDLGTVFPHLNVQHRERSGENPCMFSITVDRPWVPKKTEAEFWGRHARTSQAESGSEGAA